VYLESWMREFCEDSCPPFLLSIMMCNSCVGSRKKAFSPGYAPLLCYMLDLRLLIQLYWIGLLVVYVCMIVEMIQFVDLLSFFPSNRVGHVSFVFFRKQ
jgi:hypothetical protein